MFAPVIVACLIASPTECTALTGPAYPTLLECVESLDFNTEVFDRQPNIYVAGETCIEYLDQAASM